MAAWKVVSMASKMVARMVGSKAVLLVALMAATMVESSAIARLARDEKFTCR